MSESTEPVGEILERDHRRIDARFAEFLTGLVAGRVDTTALRAGSDGLRQHIWVEEELHFPPLRAAGLMGPVLVMLREHGEIWALLDRIDDQVGAGAAPADIRSTLIRLQGIIDAHNVKEEQILYPTGDARLDPATMDSIRQALASGVRPQGWACEMAGAAGSGRI